MSSLQFTYRATPSPCRPTERYTQHTCDWCWSHGSRALLRSTANTLLFHYIWWLAGWYCHSCAYRTEREAARWM
ncbi:unnamed protein product, partial [Dicrocoelium dendriticum]